MDLKEFAKNMERRGFDCIVGKKTAKCKKREMVRDELEGTVKVDDHSVVLSKINSGYKFRERKREKTLRGTKDSDVPYTS